MTITPATTRPEMWAGPWCSACQLLAAVFLGLRLDLALARLLDDRRRLMG